MNHKYETMFLKSQRGEGAIRLLSEAESVMRSRPSVATVREKVVNPFVVVTGTENQCKVKLRN